MTQCLPSTREKIRDMITIVCGRSACIHLKWLVNICETGINFRGKKFAKFKTIINTQCRHTRKLIPTIFLEIATFKKSCTRRPYFLINGSRVTLFFTRSRVTGGGMNPPSDLENYWADHQKNWQAVRGRYFIVKNAISSSSDHFCGNEGTSNFPKRALISGCLAATGF